MRYLAFLCCAVWLCGCSDDRLFQGRGDAGSFMLQTVGNFGGRPITTNALPSLSSDWQYAHNKFGVEVLFPESEYTNVASYIDVAFGHPHPAGGSRLFWRFGVSGYIYLDLIHTNAEVDILPKLR